MTSERVERKLAAILAADVVGYSRLMGEDEEATLKTLTTYREAMDAFIARHSGRIVGTAGDSVLAEFASAIEAVRCGIEIQQELKDRNGALPENRRMEFRIGINLGDVMIEGDDLYGDGVNVAARLENLAEAGGISISSTVFDQVRDRIPHDFEDLGEHSVKNITRPVRVYRVATSEGSSMTPADSAVGSGSRAVSEASVAVLPFENLNHDPEQDYFSDGITDDIITELSRFPNLTVIARNSVFAYKGKPVKVQTVGTELGVRYVVEGSLRKAGERVRITAQLIDATTGHHVWAERYDRKIEDIFDLQDEITETIVGALAGKLDQVERARAVRKPTDNLQAYDYLLRGYDLFLRFTKEDSAQAREMLEKAIELDPNYARAYTLLAWDQLQDVFMGRSEDPERSLTQAFELAQKALALDSSDSWSHWVVGAVLLFQRHHERSLAAMERALSIRPNDADVQAYYAVPLQYAGRIEEAETAITRALRLNPNCPWWYLWVLGWTMLRNEKFEKAISAIEQIGNPIPECRLTKIASYAALGQQMEAKREVEGLLAIAPEFSLEKWAISQPYQTQEELDRLMQLLRSAGLPN